MARGKDGLEVETMIDLVLVKNMLRYIQDECSGKNGRFLSGYHVVLRKVRLMAAWIKRKEAVGGARRIEVRN